MKKRFDSYIDDASTVHVFGSMPTWRDVWSIIKGTYEPRVITYHKPSLAIINQTRLIEDSRVFMHAEPKSRASVSRQELAEYLGSPQDVDPQRKSGVVTMLDLYPDALKSVEPV